MKRSELEDRVIVWGGDKGLLSPENLPTQTLKLAAEVGELCDEVLKKNRDKIRSEIGDCEVVLTIIKFQNGFSQNECLLDAINKVEGRTGKTINGTFIKSSDLTPPLLTALQDEMKVCEKANYLLQKENKELRDQLKKTEL